MAVNNMLSNVPGAVPYVSMVNDQANAVLINALNEKTKQYEQQLSAIAENEASNGNQYIQNIIEHMTYITTLTSYCTENIMRCYTLGEHIIIKECLLLHKAVEILNNMYNIYAV